MATVGVKVLIIRWLQVVAAIWPRIFLYSEQRPLLKRHGNRPSCYCTAASLP